jgi:hypothetical protein
MDEFHKTQMGKKFYQRDIPDMVRDLEKTWKTLDKAIVELNKIARSLENKDARTEGNKEGWLVGSHGKNDDVIVYKIYGELGDTFYIGRKYGTTEKYEALNVYYVYMDKKQMKSPSLDGSYGSLQEAFECISNELS